MTRENKLALVVGFALVLLVGILVADHFSPAHADNAADFTPEARGDGTARWPKANRETLITVDPNRGRGVDPAREANRDVRPIEPDPPVVKIRTSRDANTAGSDGTPSIQMGGNGNSGLPTGRNADSDAAALADALNNGTVEGAVYYHVGPSDTMIGICEDRYGDGSLYTALATFNDIADPSKVREGRRLLLPDADSLVRGVSRTAYLTNLMSAGREERRSEAARAVGTTGTRSVRTYTVKDNDSLWDIAAATLGSGARWEEIFDANRDQLPSEDDIRPGMVLKLPKR